MTEWTRECVRACLACHEACLRAAAYLQASEAAVAHVRLLFSTAEIVKATVNLLRGDLDVARQASPVCMELCERAARYCERFPDDAAMRACTEACRACAMAWRPPVGTAA